MKNLKYFVIALFLFSVYTDLQAQSNDLLVGSWVAKKPFQIDFDDEKFQIRGFDFLDAMESPRYEGWLEEVVSYEELIDGEVRSGLNIFVYKINEEDSTLILKSIESRVGLRKGATIIFKYGTKN